jgi:hypothetical protein
MYVFSCVSMDHLTQQALFCIHFSTSLFVFCKIWRNSIRRRPPYSFRCRLLLNTFESQTHSSSFKHTREVHTHTNTLITHPFGHISVHTHTNTLSTHLCKHISFYNICTIYRLHSSFKHTCKVHTHTNTLITHPFKHISF